MTKTVLVTGGTSGIGAAAAKEFASKGYNVVFTGRRVDKGQALATEIESAGGKAVFVKADVLSELDLDRACRTAVEKFGSLDIVMANAGYAGHPHETLDYPMDEFNKIFDINIKGTLRTFRVAVPFLVGRPDPLIVAISSASSVMPFGSYAPYAMSKAAVDSLVRTTALELMGKVRVYSINPGFCESEMQAAIFHDMPIPPVLLNEALGPNPEQKMGNGIEIAQLIMGLETGGKYADKFASGSSILDLWGEHIKPIEEATLPMRQHQLAALMKFMQQVAAAAQAPAQ